MFNKQELANLLVEIKGNLSVNELGEKCGVNPIRISRYIKCMFDSPPTKEELNKLATNDAQYEKLLEVCGYKEININRYIIGFEDDDYIQLNIIQDINRPNNPDDHQLIAEYVLNNYTNRTYEVIELDGIEQITL